MVNNQRIIIVTELFHPEESATAHILGRIAWKLDQDFNVLVLTGPQNYEGRMHNNSEPSPIDESQILRSWAPNLSKNRLLSRLARFLILTVNLSWAVISKSKPSDLILAVTNPAPLVVALALVRKIRRFKLVFLVHDVFPENAAATGMIQPGHFLYPSIKRTFDWAYGSADAIISIGRDMADVIAKKCKNNDAKISIIENWADEPLINRCPRDISLINRMNLLNHIVVQYAGNIGRAQGLLEFVELASSVQNDNIRYVFRGSGALSAELAHAVSGKQAFIVKGSYPRAEQTEILGACDVALVLLGPRMYGLGVPSKIYNILASGKPILFLGPRDSEVYRLITDHAIGWAFDWSESEELLRLLKTWSVCDVAIMKERGDRARILAETKFREALQLTKFSELFRNLAYGTR